jgi:hypothetical protein
MHVMVALGGDAPVCPLLPAGAARRFVARFGPGLPWDAVSLEAAELDIGWQLQRVRRQLLYRSTKTEASDAALPLPDICVTALRMRQNDQAERRSALGGA